MQKILLGFVPVIMTAILSYADIPSPVAKPSSNAHAQDDERFEKMKAVNEKVKSSCQANWDTTGCKDGNNLVYCVETYKKSHPEYQLSDACKSALQERTELRRQAIKENLKARKHLRPMKPDNKGMVPPPPSPVVSPAPSN